MDRAHKELEKGEGCRGTDLLGLLHDYAQCEVFSS